MRPSSARHVPRVGRVTHGRKCLRSATAHPRRRPWARAIHEQSALRRRASSGARRLFPRRRGLRGAPGDPMADGGARSTEGPGVPRSATDARSVLLGPCRWSVSTRGQRRMHSSRSPRERRRSHDARAESAADASSATTAADVTTQKWQLFGSSGGCCSSRPRSWAPAGVAGDPTRGAIAGADGRRVDHGSLGFGRALGRCAFGAPLARVSRRHAACSGVSPRVE